MHIIFQLVMIKNNLFEPCALVGLEQWIHVDLKANDFTARITLELGHLSKLGKQRLLRREAVG
jgi:hypothetical protein